MYNATFIKIKACSRTLRTAFVFVCLFVCFESHKQFYSYLATVIITGDGAAN
jgi:hypothetical protein